jgi:lysine 2,3-aminomutase
MAQDQTCRAFEAETLWDADPDIYRILRECSTLEEARDRIYEYLEQHESALMHDETPVHVLEWVNMRDCRRTLKLIFARRSERLCEFSALAAVWRLARGEQPDPPVSVAFIEDLRHLFIGLVGKSRIYEGVTLPDFVNLFGRDAAIARSDDLDGIAERVNSYALRYPTGLDPDVLEKRASNKRRILSYFEGTEDDWNDARWHLRHVITGAETLGNLVDLTDDDRRAIELARAHRIPFGITPHYLSLMDKDASRTHDHAVRAQVIPSMHYVEYMISHRGQRELASDYMLERDTSPIDLVTRRYPMIAILKPYNSCFQICVYCQRNWEIEEVLAGGALAPAAKLDAAYRWFREHPAVSEVLVTGGDPLVMSNSRIERIINTLSDIPHISRIRIGTRAPVVLPQRITDHLVEMIARYNVPGKRYVCLVTHFEHVYEVTPEAVEAIAKFNRRGMHVFNQLVFTAENSRRFECVALRQLLRNIGVAPYYTFNTKGKEETLDFRVPIARLLQEQKEEARLLPGVARTDEAVFNVPRLGKNYVRAYQHHDLIGVMPDGGRVYELHPWEKKIALADTYVETDVPIYDYLKELERRGEDLDDYKSIWYYF